MLDRTIGSIGSAGNDLEIFRIKIRCIGRIRAFALAVALFYSAVSTGAAQNSSIVEVYSETTAVSGAEDADAETPVWRVPPEVKVTIVGGYDDNRRTRSSDGDSGDGGSFFTGAEVSLDYNFGTPRTRGTLSGHAKLNYFPASNRSPFDPDLGVDLKVQHAVSERLSLIANIDARYQIEPDFDIEGSSNQRRGSYFYTKDELSATYRLLPRVSTITSYSFDTLQYTTSIAGGFGNRYQHKLSQSLRYLLLPTVSLTGSYSLSLISYDVDGRDSITHTILAGVTANLGPHLETSAAVGGQFRSMEQGTGASASSASPTANVKAIYTVSEKTSVILDARYGFSESGGRTDSSGTIMPRDTLGRTSFTTSLRLNYELTARIGTSAAARYRRYESDEADSLVVDQIGGSETAFDLSLEVHYKINPSFLTFAEWKYTNVDSDQNDRSYSRNRYSLGLTVTF